MRPEARPLTALSRLIGVLRHVRPLSHEYRGEIVRRFSARCPYCTDPSAPLTGGGRLLLVAPSPGRVFIRCTAGCDFARLTTALRELGIDGADIAPLVDGGHHA